ncbi:MAG: TIGR04255 family protein [Methanothrix sp.]
MVIMEIFPNPTVRQVIFQITFPNLFYLEGRIGSIQQKIMNEFPKSELIYRKRLLLGNIGPELKIDPKDAENVPASKIWQFESRNKTKLSITTNSLDMTSEFHKTYNLGEEEGKKFRHAIENAVGAFIEIAELPIINRIGLRYIDFCPLPKRNNKTLKKYYNSKFPLNKFEIADAETMAFQTIVKKGQYNLGYMETLKQVDGEDKIILDFDGSATDIKASEYLATTDKLHDLISEAFAETIRDPVYDHMRRSPEG